MSILSRELPMVGTSLGRRIIQYRLPDGTIAGLTSNDGMAETVSLQSIPWKQLDFAEKNILIKLDVEKRYAAFCTRKEAIEAEIERLSHTTVSCNLQSIQDILAERGSAQLKHGLPAAELLKRPQITYDDLIAIGVGNAELADNVREQVEVQIKYEGYIKMQKDQVSRVEKIENKKLSEDLDYSQITGLRNEAKQKLNAIKPASVGQASRISGVSPADISVLLVYLEQQRRQEEV